MSTDGFGREQRHHPIRRLSAAECEALEYEGPLVLSVQQMKWIVGRWRSLNHYVVTHHRRGIVWEGTRKEWTKRGLTVEGDQ